MVPPLADFTGYEQMAGEYRAMGIYPRGHLMEFVRPTLDPRVLPAAAVEDMGDGEEVLVAGWPIARQHPKGRDGTVFVTVEDETGDVQVILWPRVFHRSRRELGSHVLLVRGEVSRWDGTTNVIASEVMGIHPRVPMPQRPTTGTRRHASGVSQAPASFTVLIEIPHAVNAVHNGFTDYPLRPDVRGPVNGRSG